MEDVGIACVHVDGDGVGGDGMGGTGDRVDRAKGMLVGVAYGDALGAPCEFSGKKCDGLFHSDWVVSRRNQYGFTVTHVLGQVTDDTEMTVAAMRALTGGYSKEKAVKEYHDFVNSGTYSLGTNTKALFHNYKSVNLYDKRYAERFASRAAIDANQSNGHLMRAAPFALVEDDDVRRAIVKLDTLLTNPSDVSAWSAQLYVSMLCAVLHADDCAGARSNVRALAIAALDEHKTDECDACIEDALDPLMRSRDVTTQKGWSLHSLSLAIWSALHASSLHDGVLRIINMGGDTDTNAAIAGALLGDLFGLKLCDTDPVFAANKRTILECKPVITSGKPGTQKAVPRPERFHPQRLLEALDALLAAPPKHNLPAIKASIDAIAAMHSTKRPRGTNSVVIAIVGASRSGKTTLTRRLTSELKKTHTVEALSQDDFKAHGDIPRVQDKISWEGPQRTDWNKLAAQLCAAVKQTDIVLVEGYLLFCAPSSITTLFNLCFKCESTVELCRQRRSTFPSIEKFGDRGWESAVEYVDACVWPCHMLHEMKIAMPTLNLSSDQDISKRCEISSYFVRAYVDANK